MRGNETAQDGVRMELWPDQADFRLIFSLVSEHRSLGFTSLEQAFREVYRVVCAILSGIHWICLCVVGSVSPESTSLK